MAQEAVAAGVAMGETPSQSAAAGKAGIPAGAVAPSMKGAKEPNRSDRAAIPDPSPAVALTGESADPDTAGSPAGTSHPQKRGGDVPTGKKRAAIPSSDSNAERAQYCVSTPGNESSNTLSLIRSPVPVCTGHTPSGERCNLDPFLPHVGQPAVSGVKAESAQ